MCRTRSVVLSNLALRWCHMWPWMSFLSRAEERPLRWTEGWAVELSIKATYVGFSRVFVRLDNGNKGIYSIVGVCLALFLVGCLLACCGVQCVLSVW